MSLPYDPEGTNPINLKSETKRLSEVPNQYNCIIPTFAPFYRKDFVVTTADGVELYEGLDYYFGLYYEELSNALKRPVYGAIVLNDPSIDTVVIERLRAVGGRHMAHVTDVTLYLSNPESPPPRSTDWSEVLQRTIDITITPPPATMEEALEVDVVLQGLRLLTDAVITVADSTNASVNSFLDRMSAVVAEYESTLYETHVGNTGLNAHPLTPQQLNLALKTDTAADVTLLHSADKAKVLAATRATQLQLSDLDSLANKSNLTLLGVLGLVDSVKLSCVGGIDLENEPEQLRVTYRNGEFSVNVVVNPNSVGTLFLSSLNSTFTFNSDKSICYLNGLPLLDRARAPEFIRPNIEGADRLVTRNSPTVALIGSGTSGSKLSGDVSISPATLATRGAFEVADSGARDTVASSGYLFSLKVQVDALANRSFSINGYAFDRIIELKAADILLGNVDNTPPFLKNLNQLFIDALNNYALTTHTHTLVDIDNLKLASRTVKGLTRYTNTLVDDPTVIVYTELVDSIYNKYVAKLDDIDSTIPRTVYQGYRYEDLEVTHNYDSNTKVMRVAISQFKLIEGDSVTVVPAKTFANLERGVLVVNGVLMEGSTAGSGYKICERRDAKLLIYGDYSASLHRPFVEHQIDPLAHAVAIRNGFYSLIHNYGLVGTRVDWEASPLSIWKRMSHESFFGHQPANESELLLWKLADHHYDVTYPEPSTTFVSLVSAPAPTYQFRTDVWFDLDLNKVRKGKAVIVVGSWVADSGNQETISIVLSDTEQTEGGKNLGCLWYNYNQPTARLISNLVLGDDLVDGWTYQAYKVRATVTPQRMNIDIRFHEVLSREEAYIFNLDKEFDNQVTRPINRTVTPNEFSLDKFPSMGHGFGCLQAEGVNFRYRPQYNVSDENAYSNQIYLKEASFGETTETVVSHTQYPITFTTVEKGVYEAKANSGDNVKLVETPDFPNKVFYEPQLDGTKITIKAIYKHGDNELYEPPLALSGMLVSLVDITY